MLFNILFHYKKYLKEHSAKYYTCVVELKEEDCKAMELQI
jgi:hypothetical protein